MKKLLLMATVLFFAVAAFSQTTLYSDDFESYPSGSYIAVENPTWWDTWSGTTGGEEDAQILDDYGNSGSQSIRIDESAAGTDNTDLIWLLGDKVSGAYEANWYIYIPSGQSAYYNFQHFQSPGIEWAIQVHFLTDGSGELYAGQSDPYPFTFEHDTWIYLEHDISIDDDAAEMYIDGVLLHSWQWSLQSFGDPGTNQLGGVDFFAGGNEPGEDVYYVDDIEYVELVAPTDPGIETSPNFFNVFADEGTSTTGTITISSVGYAALDYEVHAVYDVAGMPEGISLGAEKTTYTKTFGYTDAVSAPNYKPSGTSPQTTDDEVTLNWDGENNSAIGWNNAPITIKVAAMFPMATTVPYAGMELTSMDIFINDPSEDYMILIYDMGNSYEPGELLHSQSISPEPFAWNNIILSTPVTITGADIWVAYQFTQPALDLFTPGCDAGPNNPLGDWLSTGVGWSHLGDNPDLQNNWNIRANLTGEPIVNWLSFAPASGSIPVGESVDVTVTFDATYLTEGLYSADIVIVNNDPENSLVTIPAVFHVEASPLIPPENLVGEVECMDVVLGWDPPGGGPNTEELIYDDNTSTGAYSWEGYTMATHMSPQGPCQLLEVKFWTTIQAGDNTFNCNLFDWLGSAPGTDILFTELMTALDEEWVSLDVSGENINFTDDFVVGFGSINETTFIGYDAALNNGRSWDFDNAGLTWDPWTEAYLIRAVVMYPDGSVEELAVSPSTPIIVNTENQNIARSSTGSVNTVDPIKNMSFDRALLGYNVYRDFVQINGEIVPDLFYTDEEPGLGTYSYMVKAVYDEGESLPAGPIVVTIEELDPVNNVVAANEPGSPDVYVTWEAPGVQPMWLHYDDGVNFNSIGLNDGGSFLVAARFIPEDLADFDGMSLTKIALFPLGYNNDYALKVWTGANAGTLVLDQAITGMIIEEWNEIDLDVPVMIDASMELWFGYEVIDHLVGDHPAGTDAGPAVAGYGDMISTDGTTWNSLAGFGLDYNWNVQGYVENADGAVMPMKIAANNQITNNRSNKLSVVQSEVSTPFHSVSRDLMGYNVYRNGDMLTVEPIGDLFYDDLGLPNGPYEYCITAVYGVECESVSVCDNVDIAVGIDELNNSYVNIYPNPANSFVNLEINREVNSITLLNNVGQMVYFNDNVNTNEVVVINTSSFEAGIYIVQLETVTGFITKKIAIK
ncbi:MAG: T9SS type A sorting domain-containing protein [Bacteroidales bacterium]|nr:T9SS type A sorting domain-containing protein [Bacteroidales bacterium]